MTFRGHVKNGVVILDDKVSLPDGTTVSCTLAEDNTLPAKEGAGLFGDLMSFAGKASTFPEDASKNVDHYLYGDAER